MNDAKPEFEKCDYPYCRALAMPGTGRCQRHTGIIVRDTDRREAVDTVRPKHSHGLQPRVKLLGADKNGVLLIRYKDTLYFAKEVTYP